MNGNKKKNDEVIKRFAGKGVFPHQLAFTLLIPLRCIFLSPRKLAQRLELQKDLQVLELGPGPGYFSPEMARRLPRGRLVLADIQQEMLDKAKKRLSRKGFNNVVYYLCDGKTFDFPDHSFDRIFMVTVIGEVEHKQDYLRELYRILKPGGILSISELAGDPDKMSTTEVRGLVESHGFVFDRLFGRENNYTIHFKKQPETIPFMETVDETS